MNTIKTVTFPDGTRGRSDETTHHGWAIAAPPVDLSRIQEIDADRTLSIAAEIMNLENEIANPTIVTEATAPSTDPSAPILKNARLSNSTLSLIVDEDDDVVDVAGYLNDDGPLFPKTGVQLEAALLTQARDRISELRGSEDANFGLGSGPADDRLGWHVVRWMASEERAEKFAVQMNEKRRSADYVVVLQATAEEQ